MGPVLWRRDLNHDHCQAAITLRPRDFPAPDQDLENRRHCGLPATIHKLRRSLQSGGQQASPASDAGQALVPWHAPASEPQLVQLACRMGTRGRQSGGSSARWRPLAYRDDGPHREQQWPAVLPHPCPSQQGCLGYACSFATSAAASSCLLCDPSAASIFSASVRSARNLYPSTTRATMPPRSGFWSLRSSAVRSPIS